MFGSKTTSANANSAASLPNISRAARKTSDFVYLIWPLLRV
jgi:hypothetical protein